MTPDMTNRISSADWGERSRILTNHLKGLILQGEWQPGQKLPSARQLAETYGISIETVRSALSELHGQGLILTKARSGSVVLERPLSKPSTLSPSIAFIRLLSPRLPRVGTSYNEILPTLESCLLEEDLQVSLVTERPETADRARRMLSRLEEMGDSLKGAILLRPAQDMLQQIVPMLQQRGIPYVIIGRRRHDDMNNCVEPDYIGMGQVIGKYLVAIDAKTIFLPTLALNQPQAYSGIERCQGIVSSYLLADKSLPRIIPINCETTDENHCEAVVGRYMESTGDKPDAIVGFGDRLSLGAMRACMDRGMNVPEDVAVFGTTGLVEAAYFIPSLTTADQQIPLLAETAAAAMLEMIREGRTTCQTRLTPVRFIFRESTVMNAATKAALANEFASGQAVMERGLNQKG